MIEALILFLLANGVSFIAGAVAGRLTAPPSSVTIDPYGNELPARFRAAEAHQFDLRPTLSREEMQAKLVREAEAAWRANLPSGKIIPFRGGKA